MYQDFIIRPLDFVRCVDASCNSSHPLSARCRDRLEEGKIYRVSRVVWLHGEKGLHLEGKDHRPTEGWRVARFRKILSSEEHASLPIGDAQISEPPLAKANTAAIGAAYDAQWASGIRVRIEKLAVSREVARGPYALILEVGHIDAGAYSNTPIVISNLSLEDAQVALRPARESVIKFLLHALRIVRRGLADGSLTDDGPSEYAIAMIAAEGPDDSIVSVEGFHVLCSTDPQDMVSIDWEEERWSDYLNGSLEAHRP